MSIPSFSNRIVKKRSVVSFLALGALAGFILYRLPLAIHTSHQCLKDGMKYGAEDFASTRSRYLGKLYVEAIWKIREVIPPNEEYFIVEGTDNEMTSYFVRFDLAPRPCLFLGRVKDLKRDFSLRRRPMDLPRYVVIARLDGAGPVVKDAASFFSSGDSR